MTPEQVRAAVEDMKSRIRPNGMCDDEALHSQEDSLWGEVLEAIANGAPDAAGLAREAIRTNDLDFSRWCA